MADKGPFTTWQLFSVSPVGSLANGDTVTIGDGLPIQFTYDGTDNSWKVGTSIDDLRAARNATPAVIVTVAASIQEYDISTDSDYDDASDMTLTVNAGQYLWSNDTSKGGLIIPSTYTGTLTVENSGYIIGKGGNGGIGAGTGAGTNGGPAIQNLSTTATVIVNNAAGAYVAGGGGGGGGSGVNGTFTHGIGGGGAGGGGSTGGSGGAIGAAGGNAVSGSGGGAGGGGGVYATGSSGFLSVGGGGGRILPGTGGAGAGGGGTGGSAGGVGGTGTASAGGGGGGWGANGGAGGLGGFGAGGAAATTAGGTVTITGGTVYGATP